MLRGGPRDNESADADVVAGLNESASGEVKGLQGGDR